MTTTTQRRAARSNVKKAQADAKRKQTLKNFPKTGYLQLVSRVRLKNPAPG